MTAIFLCKNGVEWNGDVCDILHLFQSGISIFLFVDHILLGQVKETVYVTDEFDCHRRFMQNNTCKSFNVHPPKSNTMCYLDTHIKTGDTTTPFRISIYDKSDDFTFRIVNFPHMDSNIPANPAYGVYISQLVRYARICTSKVDFMNRLRGLSLRLRQQGFLTNLLQRTFTKFFNRHGLIVVKYGATLRKMRFAIQA